MSQRPTDPGESDAASLAARIRHSIDTPEKEPDLVLRPSHRDGDFHAMAVDCPFAFHREGRLGMTFVGWDGVGYQSGLSWYSEREGWSEPELIFPRDPGSVHRKYNSALTSIMRDNALRGSGELQQEDGWYYGTYHAYPRPGYEEGSGVIGVVRSRDLLSWEERGELLLPGDGAAWERGGLYKSWLMKAEGQYWLFYNAKNRSDGGWVEQTGAATSSDLVHWERLSDQPLVRNGGPGSLDERFASDPCVLHYEGVWIMFYFGLSADGVARDTYAVSSDLRTWHRTEEVLVDVGPPGSIDSEYAHKPAVIRHGQRLEHYYCGVSRLAKPVRIGERAQGELRGIAVARSAVRGGM